MKKFWIEIHFEVDARDYDEAVDISKAVRATIVDGNVDYAEVAAHGYKLRNVETQTIAEV